MNFFEMMVMAISCLNLIVMIGFYFLLARDFMSLEDDFEPKCHPSDEHLTLDDLLDHIEMLRKSSGTMSIDELKELALQKRAYATYLFLRGLL